MIGKVRNNKNNFNSNSKNSKSKNNSNNSSTPSATPKKNKNNSKSNSKNKNNSKNKKQNSQSSINLNSTTPIQDLIEEYMQESNQNQNSQNSKTYKINFTPNDVKTYKNLALRKSKQKKFTKTYPYMYQIEGLTPTSILIYSFIKNEVELHKSSSIYFQIQQYKISHTDTTKEELSKEIKILSNFLKDTPLSNYPTEITLEKFQEYKSTLSHNTLNKSINQLVEYGFISIKENSNKTGRVFTLLEDVEGITISEVEGLYKLCEELGYDNSWIKNLVYLVHYKDKERFASLVLQYHKEK